MTIYVDLVFFLNGAYDFLLLLTVNLALKRFAKLKRILGASLLGALSLIILFLPLSPMLLFLFKVGVSIIMVLIAYGYKDPKYFFRNLSYLYMCSIILGGFLYFLNTQFSYSVQGLVFIHDGFSINYLVLLIISPLILGAYLRELKKIKKLYNYTYQVKIVFKNQKVITCQGFLDSGNKLKDPVTHKYIILVEPGIMPRGKLIPMYVPFKTVAEEGLLECFAINYIEINDHKYHNYLIGLAPEKFNMSGINCLLNNKLLEELC